MDSVERSIVVDVPAYKAFNAWVRFEDWPAFLKAIRSVQRLDESKFRILTERSGEEHEAIVEVSLLIPQKRIAWRTVAGVEKSGVVCFNPLTEGRTEVVFKMLYRTEAGWNHPEVLEKRLEFHLACFKEFIEKAGGK